MTAELALNMPTWHCQVGITKRTVQDSKRNLLGGSRRGWQSAVFKRIQTRSILSLDSRRDLFPEFRLFRGSLVHWKFEKEPPICFCSSAICHCEIRELFEINFSKLRLQPQSNGLNSFWRKDCLPISEHTRKSIRLETSQSSVWQPESGSARETADEHNSSGLDQTDEFASLIRDSSSIIVEGGFPANLSGRDRIGFWERYALSANIETRQFLMLFDSPSLTTSHLCRFQISCSLMCGSQTTHR